jgi:oligo-1,6-glucosidase
MKKIWWKDSVVYQIYPRSFNDTSGNGIGDIKGIIDKLDYIKSLGVNTIWLCPIYESPNVDNGYDISDYKKIMPEFGSQSDFDTLLNGMHSRGLKLVMDLVVNHTSDAHYWFKESRKSTTSPYRDYYIWKKGKNGGPPNDWISFFGGSAWQYDELTDEYFLCLFTKQQPDLNWENPKVREDIYEVMHYWFKKGVDGFRMDVISLISKQTDFPDAHTTDFGEIISKYYANGPKIHTYLKEMNDKVLSKYDIMTVGEGPGIDLENGPLYVKENRNELNMIFHFGHMFMDNGPGGKYDPIPTDLLMFKNVFNNWDAALKKDGWNSIFLGNHDFSRMVSKFGDDSDEFREASAKLLATLLLTLRGTVYIYQGDEIGMTNVAFPSIDDYDDVETLNNWSEAKANGKDMESFLKIVHQQSRDNARTPMQWTSEKNAGFSNEAPWIKVNPNYPKINVASQQNDPGSILNYYREMIALRKKHEVLVYGDYECLDFENPFIYAYKRKDEHTEFLILHNFSGNSIDWHSTLNAEEYELIKTNISSLETKHLFKLSPWQAKVLKYMK